MRPITKWRDDISADSPCGAMVREDKSSERTHQNVVLSTTILTVPGSPPLRRVKVSSMSIARSDS